MTYHNNPEDMARCLIAYMPCDRAVQREVGAAFVSAPPLSTIKRLRASHKYQDGEAARWRALRPLQGLADKDAAYEAQMAAASAHFAERLVAVGRHV